MKKNILSFILPLILMSSAMAQDSLYNINGRVVDELTKLPLNNVNVQIGGTLKATTTNASGVFKFSAKEKDILLICSMIGYEKKSIRVNYKSYGNLLIRLSQRTQKLNEVVVNASPIEPVAKSKNYNVLDYDFYGDNILLITYSNDLSKSKLTLINQSFDTLSKITIPGEPTRLFKDCLGNNHVVCEKFVYQVYLDSAGLLLLPAQPLQYFEKMIHPCVAEDSLNLYLVKKYGAQPVDAGFHVFNSHNHTVNYSYVNKFTKTKNTLTNIMDDGTIRNRENELQFEKSKQAAGMYSHGSPELDRLFFETILTKEVYAPLYAINNKIYLFNYINSSIQNYSSTGQLINNVEIKFQKEKHWKRQMCVDEKNGKAFAIFESNGITELREVNLATGNINQTYKIPFVFIKDIKVYDNYIYFLYKGNDYYDTRYLSRLKLN